MEVLEHINKSQNVVKSTFRDFSYEYYLYVHLFISRTICASSGKINFSIASETAPVEPGVEKITVCCAMPAMALESIAAEPISL